LTYNALRYAIVMFRIGRRQLLFGEMEMPAELGRHDRHPLRTRSAARRGLPADRTRLSKRLVARSRVPVMDQQAVSSLFDLTDRVAVITGGTRGIGLAIAQGFAGAGAKVVVASRKPEACAAAEKPPDRWRGGGARCRHPSRRAERAS